MGSNSMRVGVVALLLLCASVMHARGLDIDFYSVTCPTLQDVVLGVITNASIDDPRIGASLIRLHFHDCFVQGCDASNLLNNTATIESEQNAALSNNSIRGLDVVNKIKTAVEAVCPQQVSCADILALAAQASSYLAGGPSWNVPLGRRDSLTANRSLADQNIPSPYSTLDQLKASFLLQGLNTTDLVALSGAHTFGKSHCRYFVDRLYNFNNTGNPDPTLDTYYLQTLQTICLQNGNGNNLTNLDDSTPNTFDNKYYSNINSLKGLLQSDQELYSTPGDDIIATLVNTYSTNTSAFFDQFAISMIKMSNIGVLTGNQGEIRSQCNYINGP